jgi:tRNA threonylcarbamoyl adenosine modification protein YjeE
VLERFGGTADASRATAATLTEPQLAAWGEAIGRAAGTPLVMALDGDLGAGKSTLARAIARGAGVEGEVPSPTFNLAFRYDTPRVTLHHLDLYRLERMDDVWELGWSELGAPGDVVLIEWADNAEPILPRPRWEVRLEETGRPDRRVLLLAPVDDPPPLPPLPAEAP